MEKDSNRQTPYTLVKAEIDGLDPIFFEGGEISEEYTSKDEYISDRYERFSQTLSEYKVAWKFDKTRDHKGLQQLLEKCVKQHKKFTITWFGFDEQGRWMVLERTTGASIHSRKRKLGNKEQPMIDVEGTADKTEVVNTSYD